MYVSIGVLYYWLEYAGAYTMTNNKIFSGLAV